MAAGCWQPESNGGRKSTRYGKFRPHCPPPPPLLSERDRGWNEPWGNGGGNWENTGKGPKQRGRNREKRGWMSIEKGAATGRDGGRNWEKREQEQAERGWQLRDFF